MFLVLVRWIYERKNMIRRLTRIKSEFGTYAFFRVLLMLVGLPGMAALGWFALGTLIPLLIATVGLIAGYVLRKVMVDNFETLTWALPAALFAYGIVGFLGERLGLSRAGQLAIITAVTVIAFNVMFWCLSDPDFVNSESV